MHFRLEEIQKKKENKMRLENLFDICLFLKIDYFSRFPYFLLKTIANITKLVNVIAIIIYSTLAAVLFLIALHSSEKSWAGTFD